MHDNTSRSTIPLHHCHITLGLSVGANTCIVASTILQHDCHAVLIFIIGAKACIAATGAVALLQFRFECLG